MKEIWFDFIGNEVYIYDGVLTKTTRIFKDGLYVVNYKGMNYFFK